MSDTIIISKNARIGGFHRVRQVTDVTIRKGPHIHAATKLLLEHLAGIQSGKTEKGKGGK